jgi:hypothetical protein
MTSKKIVIVAGMHRSGTSALTRAINLAGVPLPSNLMPATPENRDGYWEPVDLVVFHDKILKSFESQWDDFREVPQAWFDGDEAERFGIGLSEWITEEIAGKDGLLIKDPRLCRLLPLWQKVCAALGIDIYTVIVVRNPIEVVRSLQTRNQFLPMKSAILWLRHFIDAERFTRGRQRSFVDFDGLMNNALSTIQRIAAELGLVFPVPDSELAPLLDAALKPSLRHHVATRDDLAKTGAPTSPPMVVYPWVLDAAEGKNPPFSVLDDVLNQLRELEKGRSISYPLAS